MPDFGMRKSAGGVYLPGANWGATKKNLQSRGYTLPNSGYQATIESKKVVSDVTGRGTVVDVKNRAMMQAMRADRIKAKMGTNGMARTAANVQMVLPKVRQPLGSLMDKGIPFNVQDPEELTELRRWCRLFAATHHLVPLLIDIYSTFPVCGMEFSCKDKKIESFYESMFLDTLNYNDFLPNGLMREYYTVGEVTSLAHFNEELGIWSSEEILNPDMVRVSKSLFVEQERVQLLVKDLVESLRSGPQGMSPSQESPSEKFERTWEYEQITKRYPEIIKAAMQDDGLDISDALVSRMVNKAAWWDLRGTPILLRSFPTLMLEESLNAAQDAVADRLYAPMIVATLGLEGAMGDGEPWLPEPGELEDLRDDIQSALAADFKLIVHNFGLKIESVFGRESVPRFDTDFDRITTNLLTAWGVGQSLIMGGTGAGGTYASSAINREVCEQLMRSLDENETVPVLQSWRGGPVIRTFKKLWEQFSESHDVKIEDDLETIDLPSNNGVYTICFKNGMGNWGRIKRIMRHRYSGDLIRLNQKWGEVTVTPNHAVYNSMGQLVESVTNPELLAVRYLNQPHLQNGENVSLTLPSVAFSRDDECFYYVMKKPKGTRHRKLTAQQMSEVFALTHQGISQVKIAEQYQITRRFVRKIKSNDCWDWRRELETGVTAPLEEIFVTNPRSKLFRYYEGDDLENLVRFIGAWVAEGSAHISKAGGGIIDIANTDREWLESLQPLLKSIAGDQSSAVQKAAPPQGNRKQLYHLRICNRPLAIWLKNNCGNDSHTKKLPDFVFGLSKRYIDALLKEMVFGDGTDKASGHWNYFSSSPELAHGVSLLCLLHGIQYTVNKTVDKGVYRIGGCGSYQSRSNEVHRMERVPYDGWVYDFEMEDSEVANFTAGVGMVVVHNTAQLKATRHMRKRMEIVAEAQEHYDFEMKGGIRKPIYREVVEYNEEAGEEEIVRVPKLLIPDIKFASLNLRDEATERSFVSQLKQLGVPISDKTLAINIPFEFEEELERQSSETYDKGCAQAEAYHALQERCDSEGWPYPAELNQHLQSTVQTRAMLAQAEMAEGQNKMMDQQIAQASPAGMMGILPGTTMQPLAGSGAVAPPGDPSGGADPGGAMPPSEADPGATADPTLGAGAPMPGDPSQLGYGQLTATMHGPRMHPPHVMPPGGPVDPPISTQAEIPHNNQTRPPESDEMRSEMPKKVGRRSTAMPGKGPQDKTEHGVIDIHALKKMNRGPSSYKKSWGVDEERVERAIQRRAASNHPHLEDLVYDPNFWAMTNSQIYERQIQADFAEIQAGGAPESARILEDLVEHYEDITGISVRR